ncbi:TetR/AcrR family transcriptional regulator [Pseudonocardia sp. DLS-67]
MSTRDERADETRRELLRVARELFADRGYGAVGTEEIVARAGLTRGALYHHFQGKRDLFRAVHEQLEEELVAEIASRLGDVTDAEALLDAGVRAFLDSCTDPRRARVTLVDAPTVLGWAEWREIDERHGLGLVTAALNGAMDAGAIARQDARPLAHLVIGALGEAALLIANAEDPAAMRGQVEPALLALVGGLRARPPDR